MINDEMYYPEVLDQTEKTVITINNEEIEVDVNDKLFNISEEEINSSLYALNTQKCKAKKKTAKQISEELVSDFLTTRSDESWKNLQEYFYNLEWLEQNLTLPDIPLRQVLEILLVYDI